MDWVLVLKATNGLKSVHMKVYKHSNSNFLLTGQEELIIKNILRSKGTDEIKCGKKTTDDIEGIASQQHLKYFVFYQDGLVSNNRQQCAVGEKKIKENETQRVKYKQTCNIYSIQKKSLGRLYHRLTSIIFQLIWRF